MASGSSRNSFSGRDSRDVDFRVLQRDLDMRGQKDIDMRSLDIDERSNSKEISKNKRSTAAQFFSQTEDSTSTQEMVMSKYSTFICPSPTGHCLRKKNIFISKIMIKTKFQCLLS